MAFHVVQAQHSSPVVVVVAFVFLFHAAAQLILYHLKKNNKKHSHWCGFQMFAPNLKAFEKQEVKTCCLQHSYSTRGTQTLSGTRGHCRMYTAFCCGKFVVVFNETDFVLFFWTRWVNQPMRRSLSWTILISPQLLKKLQFILFKCLYQW